MDITVRTNRESGMAAGSASAERANEAGRGDKTNKRNTINAADLNIAYDRKSAVDSKRSLARKQAMKLISDAWKSDNDVQKNIDTMADKKAALVDASGKLGEKIGNIEKEKEACREQYGVDENSEEQHDLELLEKYQNNMYGSGNDSFSEEEIKRLKELQSEPLTEYQKEVISLNTSKIALQSEIENNEYKIRAYAQSISLARMDQNKSQTMLKAQDSADEILDAAESEVVNMLVNEGKENIDKTAEESQDKAEEKAEKEQNKEVLDEKIKERREKAAEQKELIREQSDADRLEDNMSVADASINQVDEAQKQIVQILKENKMVNEDIKGIKIDLDF